MTSRWARFVRGQVVAVFATFVAAFSHGFADGAHPPLVAVVLALAFSSVACVLLATARLSRVRLAASVSVSQLLYHGLFSLFGPAATSGGAVVSGHHGMVTFVPGTVAGSTEQLAQAASGQWMLVAHVGAAVLTFAMLVHGERTLLAIADLGVLLVAALAWHLPRVPAPLPLPTRFAGADRAETPRRLLLLVSSLSHRGPPRSARFA